MDRRQDYYKYYNNRRQNSNNNDLRYTTKRPGQRLRVSNTNDCCISFWKSLFHCLIPIPRSGLVDEEKGLLPPRPPQRQYQQQRRPSERPATYGTYPQSASYRSPGPRRPSNPGARQVRPQQPRRVPGPTRIDTSVRPSDPRTMIPPRISITPSTTPRSSVSMPSAPISASTWTSPKQPSSASSGAPRSQPRTVRAKQVRYKPIYEFPPPDSGIGMWGLNRTERTRPIRAEDVYDLSKRSPKFKAAAKAAISTSSLESPESGSPPRKRASPREVLRQSQGPRQVYTDTGSTPSMVRDPAWYYVDSTVTQPTLNVPRNPNRRLKHAKASVSRNTVAGKHLSAESQI